MCVKKFQGVFQRGVYFCHVANENKLNECYGSYKNCIWVWEGGGERSQKGIQRSFVAFNGTSWCLVVFGIPQPRS